MYNPNETLLSRQNTALHDEAGDPYSARSGASLRRFRELLSDLDDGFDEPADDVGHLELHDLRHLALYARP